jgi:hypothetical protein
LAQNHSFEANLTTAYLRPNHVQVKANALIYMAVNKFFYNSYKSEDMQKNFQKHPDVFYRISRCFTALISSLSILLVFLIGQRFFNKIEKTIIGDYTPPPHHIGDI